MLDWDKHFDNISNAFRRLSYIPQLSTFGRGFGSAAYGVSKLLYAAEFSDLPNNKQLTALMRAVAQLVDRGQQPGAGTFKFPGVAASLLAGSPKEGGFGALPWLEHIRARHAWWGAMFATAPADTDIPWIQIGRAHLRATPPYFTNMDQCAWWGPLALFDSAHATQCPADHCRPPPAPLRRMIIGLQSLGPVSDVAAYHRSPHHQCQQQQHHHQQHHQQQHQQQLQQHQQQQGQQQQQQQQQQHQQPQQQQQLGSLLLQQHPTHHNPPQLQLPVNHDLQAVQAPFLQPGPWCARVPLFGNPFLQGIPGSHPGGLQELLVPQPRSLWAGGGGLIRLILHSVGDLARALQQVQALEAGGHPHPRGYGTWDTELRDLQQLADALPCGWFHAAATAVQSQPTWTSLSADMYNVSRRLPSAAEQQLELALVSRLGWRQWSLGKPILLSDLTVKTATSLQLGPLRTTRKQKFQQFASEALISQPRRVVAGIGCVHKAQKQLWKLRWDNHFKEIYWRLPLDGLCTAARMHHADDYCLCGAQQPGRAHHFWHCPVAQAVVQHVVQQLPAAWCTRPPNRPTLLMHHLWLMQPPPGPRPIHPGVWQVVCLAALNAIDLGRQATNEFRLQQRQMSASANVSTSRGRNQLSPVQGPLTYAQHLHNQSIQQRRQQQWQQPATQRLEEVKQQSIARFWELLTDFAVMNVVHDVWTSAVAVDHPFLCTDPLTNFLVLAPHTV